MKISKEEIKILLGHLVDMQYSCAPIELCIGRVNQVVENGYVILREAPPVVASKLLELGYSLDITKDGVIVGKASV